MLHPAPVARDHGPVPERDAIAVRVEPDGRRGAPVHGHRGPAPVEIELAELPAAHPGEHAEMAVQARRGARRAVTLRHVLRGAVPAEEGQPRTRADGENDEDDAGRNEQPAVAAAMPAGRPELEPAQSRASGVMAPAASTKAGPTTHWLKWM